MKYKIDLHCHSIASGHAYSTIAEIARAASKKGLQMIGITDHGPALPGGTHDFFFSNLKVLPETMYAIRILRGVEANIMDFSGSLDLGENRLEVLDIVLAGFHNPCIQAGSEKENTRGMVGAIKNRFVDIIVHPGNPAFPIDFHQVLDAAKDYDKLIEINNSSFGVSRKGSEENCMRIAELCLEHGVNVAVGSDSHIAKDVGEFGKVHEIFKKIGMPEEIIMNLSVSRFTAFLKSRGKSRFV